VTMVRLYGMEKRARRICKLRETKVSNFGIHLFQGGLVSNVAKVVVTAVDDASINDLLGHGMGLLCLYKSLEN
jgi:hypothetical protein